jgi:spectinomycin phosphotransferase
MVHNWCLSGDGPDDGDQFGERLRTWLRDDFGLDAVRLDPVTTGADAAALLWRAAGDDGATYAVKWTRGGTVTGSVVAAHLAAAGVPGVVGPRRTRSGELSSRRDGRRLSVTPWVDGAPAVTVDLGPVGWRSFGVLLGAVHATVPDDELRAWLSVDPTDHEEVTDAVSAVGARLADASWLDDDGHVGALRDLWRESATALEALVRGADRLGDILDGQARAGRPAPLVICHADPHQGNVVQAADGTVRLLDWDDAVLAPRERDLAFFLGGGLYAENPVTEQQQAWFLAGYGARGGAGGGGAGIGAVDVSRQRLAYYAAVRALWDAADWAHTVLDDGAPAAGRARALDVVRDTLSACGQVARARVLVARAG